MKFLLKNHSTKLTHWGPLVLRVALGAIFVYHGYDKVFVKGIPAISGFLASLGLPLPTLMAYLLSYGEFVGGILLIIGLLTYWVTLIDMVIGAVAFATVHMTHGFSVGQGGYEFIMLIFAAAFALFVSGPGRYAVDHHLKKN